MGVRQLIAQETSYRVATELAISQMSKSQKQHRQAQLDLPLRVILVSVQHVLVRFLERSQHQ